MGLNIFGNPFSELFGDQGNSKNNISYLGQEQKRLAAPVDYGDDAFNQSLYKYGRNISEAQDVYDAATTKGRGEIATGVRNAQARYEPYAKAGAGALTAYQASLGQTGGAARAGVLDTFRASPGYQFALKQGLQGVESNAAATGMRGSGAEMKELQRTGAGLADQEYGKFQTKLAQLSGLGEQAAGAQAQIGSQGALQEAQLTTEGGKGIASLEAQKGQGLLNATTTHQQMIQQSQMQVRQLQAAVASGQMTEAQAHDVLMQHQREFAMKFNQSADQYEEKRHSDEAMAAWKGMGSVMGAAAGLLI